MGHVAPSIIHMLTYLYTSQTKTHTNTANERAMSAYQADRNYFNSRLGHSEASYHVIGADTGGEGNGEYQSVGGVSENHVTPAAGQVPQQY